jgi:hypothetical protein
VTRPYRVTKSITLADSWNADLSEPGLCQLHPQPIDLHLPQPGQPHTSIPDRRRGQRSRRGPHPVRALRIPADLERHCTVQNLALTAVSLSDAIGGGPLEAALMADRIALLGDLLIAGADPAGNDTDVPYAVIMAVHSTGLLPCHCPHGWPRPEPGER